jgi:N-acetylglucosamine kinase-like BadF-type ATPase
MAPVEFVVGVDGGGTHTRVALARRDGRVFGEGAGGPGNLQDVGPERFTANLAAAWRAAWEAADQAPRPAASAFLGLASVSTDAEARVAHDVARAVGLARGRIDVDHDLRVALAGALAGEPGIVLIVGTGSSCYGRTAEGRAWRAGGWGWRLDDVGAASDLGRRAMVAAVHETDGRGAPTVLTPRVLAALGLRDVGELPGHLATKMQRTDVAALAPLVTAAAQEGDPVARALVEHGAGALATCVATVAQRLAFDAPRVAVVGSVASALGYACSLRAAIQARVPAARQVPPRSTPVRGAAFLALAAGGELDGDARARLWAAPGASLP